MGAFPLPPRHANGKLPAFTDLGGYTLIYLTARGDVLCASCASTDETDDPATCCGTYDEGAPLDCEACGTMIESSYGEVDDV